MTTLNEKGLRETITGLSEILKAASNAEARAERALSEAETELHAMRMIRAYVQDQQRQYAAQLRALLDA